jgi:cytoplasmic iron level regulating protein YaaA (DUF328/UPF0246 family)
MRHSRPRLGQLSDHAYPAPAIVSRMIVLIHSSKTMRESGPGSASTTVPALLDRAQELVAYLRTLSPRQMGDAMSLSTSLAAKTHELYAAWQADPARQEPAIESFLGDIYSGLQAATFTPTQRRYANGHLRILSGLYGVLRPYDGICPYRLEMGCRLPDRRYANLYRFWGSAIADQLPRTGPIVNLAATEYSRVVTEQVDATRVITPRFLTVEPRSGEPRFVAVHAKIARGAFARWLVVQRAKSAAALAEFSDLGYRYAPEAGTAREPCFVCTEFGGKGLSVRRSGASRDA